MAGVTLTFTQLTDVGGDGDSVSIDGQVVYGTDYWDEQWNQIAYRTGDGAKKNYTTEGVVVCSAVLVVKGVTDSEGRAFLDWLRDDLIYQRYHFKIEYNQAGIDLGRGDNTDILEADFPQSTDKGIWKKYAPGVYDFRIPYEFKR